MTGAVALATVVTTASDPVASRSTQGVRMVISIAFLTLLVAAQVQCTGVHIGTDPLPRQLEVVLSALEQRRLQQEAEVLADILNHFGWTYVNIIQTDHAEFFRMTEALQLQMSSLDLCIARRYITDFDYEHVLRQIHEQKSLTNVLLSNCTDTNGLLEAESNLEPDHAHHMLFLMGTGWHGSASCPMNRALGSLAVRYHTPLYNVFYENIQDALQGPNAHWIKPIYEFIYDCHFLPLDNEAQCLGIPGTDMMPLELISSQKLVWLHAFGHAFQSVAQGGSHRDTGETTLEEDAFYQLASQADLTGEFISTRFGTA